MRKRIFILGVLLCLITCVPVSVQSKNKTNVKLEIISANKKKFIFKLTNSGKKDCHIPFYPWKLQKGKYQLTIRKYRAKFEIK